LEKVEIPEDFKKWALNALKEANSQEITDREQIYSSQRKEYEACVRKIDNLIDMRANEEIDASEFMVRKEHLLKEKERYTELLKDTDQRVTNWLEIAERGFNFAERAVIAFEKAKKENNIELKKETIYWIRKKPVPIIAASTKFCQLILRYILTIMATAAAGMVTLSKIRYQRASIMKITIKTAIKNQFRAKISQSKGLKKAAATKRSAVTASTTGYCHEMVS
jgi:hypothetical protein